MRVFYIRFLFLIIAMVEHTRLQAADLDDLIEGLDRLFVSSQPYHLCRKSGDSVSANYVNIADGIVLADMRSSDLSAAKLAEKVAGFAKEDGYKSHVLAAPFVTTSEGIQSRLFTTSDGFPGFQSDVRIGLDWASKLSTKQPAGVSKKRSGEGNGHSEPQLVKDFGDLMTQDSGKVVKFYTDMAGEQTLKQCGLSLYGSFDMCDACMATLMDFQKHATTQTGIVSALKNKLKDGFRGDSFPVIYQSQWPYKAKDASMPQAKYSMRNDEEVLDVSYDYSFKGERQDTFSAQLVQSGSLNVHNPMCVRLDSNTLHAHIHQLEGKKTKSSSGKFVF